MQLLKLQELGIKVLQNREAYFPKTRVKSGRMAPADRRRIGSTKQIKLCIKITIMKSSLCWAGKDFAFRYVSRIS